MALSTTQYDAAELLTFILQDAKLSLDDVAASMMEKKKNKILEEHLHLPIYYFLYIYHKYRLGFFL